MAYFSYDNLSNIIIGFDIFMIALLIVSIIYYVQWQIQDFPDRDANTWVWGENLLFGRIFTENCMKMKQFGPKGDAHP